MNETPKPGLKTALKKFWPLAIVLALLVAIVVANAWMLHKRKAKPTLAADLATPENQAPPVAVDFPEDAALRGFLAAFGERIEDLEARKETEDRRWKDLESNLAQRSKALDAVQEALREVADRLGLAQDDAESAEQRSAHAMDQVRELINNNATPAAPAIPTAPAKPQPQAPRLKRLQWGPVVRAVAEDAAPRAPKKFLHLPAGAFADATLLSGVWAPVNTNNQPLPVLLRLNEAYCGPNARKVPLTDAFLIGKAMGDANSERAIIQLERLSVVLPSGEAFDTKVSGYVVAADGHQGVPGTYQWNIGKILPGQFAAGGLAGAAEALAEGESTTVVTGAGGVVNAVTGNAARRAGLKGLSAGLQKFSNIFDQRLAEIQSAVVVNNGAKLSAVMLAGVTIEGYELSSAKEAKDAAYKLVD